MRPSIVGVLCLTVVACAPGSEVDPQEPTDETRRARVRTELRAALGRSYDEPVAEVSEEEFLRGARIYDVLCVGCHGRFGRGRGQVAGTLPIPPGDLTDPKRASFFSQRARLRIIADGIQGTPMIGWKEMLDDREQRAVHAYVESLVAAGRKGGPP